MTRSSGDGAGRRATAASCRRSTGRRGRRRGGGDRGRGRRGRPRRRAANRSRSARDDVSTRTSRPVSVSMSVRSPTSGSSSSRGSRISTTSTCGRAATAASGGRASRAARGSRRRGRRARRAERRRPRNRSADAGDRAPIGLAVAGQRVVARGEQRREQALAAAARWHPAVGPAAERDRPEPVAALRRHVAERERDALGDVGLAPVGGPERHRRRDVEQRASSSAPAPGRGPGRGAPSSGRSRSSRSCGRRRPARTAGPGRAPCRRRGRAPGTRPESRPWIRRPTVTSSERSSASGVGPGPGTGLRPGRPRPSRGHRSGHADSSARGHLRDRHGRDEAVEDHVRRDLLGERREARHDPVAEDVAGELGDVGREDVAPAADDCQGAGRVDEVDRAARAGPERDVLLDLRQADGVRACGWRRSGRRRSRRSSGRRRRRRSAAGARRGRRR